MRQFKIDKGDMFSMNQALFLSIKLITIGDNEWVYGSFAIYADHALVVCPALF